MSRPFERGAVLVETALIVATALTLMLFTVDIGILGFAQVSADAASFFDAHENVIGVAHTSDGTPEQVTSGLFPMIKQSAMTTAVVPAPTPDVPVNYGYNAPVPDPNSANERQGGASMMQPVQLQVTVSPQPFFSIAGQSVGVNSQFQEPQWTECGPHYNVANENYACGDPSAPPDSTTTLTGGENTPPYYVGYNLFSHCLDAQPWGDTSNGYEATCQTTNFLALGVAEYLDTDNWNNTNNGVSGTYGSSVFHAAAFHQRVYANIATFLAKYPTLFPLYYDYSKGIYTQLGLNPTLGFASGPGSGFQDNRTWNAFAVSNTSDPAKADPNGIDEAIQCVYNWDETITSGFPPGTYEEPGDDPLYPDKACAANVTL